MKGPKFINRQTYTLEAMKSQFMRCEQDLVADLMATVFNTEENLPYSEELLTPLIVVSSHFEFDASVALRKSTVLFHASPAADEHRDVISWISSSLVALRGILPKKTCRDTVPNQRSWRLKLF